MSHQHSSVVQTISKVPLDYFHCHQQFQNILAAKELQEIGIYLQMNYYFSKLGAGPNERVQEIPLPKTVNLVLHIHGNEFRHLMTKLPYFGGKILEKMPAIHSKTGCQISLADHIVGKFDDFNKIKFTGTIETVENALNEFLDVLPLHVGFHLSDLKNELKNCDLRSKLFEWMESGVYNYTAISFHFVRDVRQSKDVVYKYVVLRTERGNSQYLIDAAKTFSELVLNTPIVDEFSAGYRLPDSDRIWFTGHPDSSLARTISKMSNTTIKYSNPAMSNTIPGQKSPLDYNVFGKPECLIHANELIRCVAQVSLEFDVNDKDLKFPFNKSINFEQQFVKKNFVIVSYAKSKYQLEPIDQFTALRHCVTIRTSYENRHMLYKTRREILKEELTKDLPLNEAEMSPEKLKFADYLYSILKEILKQSSSHRAGSR